MCLVLFLYYDRKLCLLFIYMEQDQGLDIGDRRKACGH